ncbi:MAG: hypothetical protein BYD32DRAFT_68471 [Podila humilis]|nr:MAG: hypothetical protein BYD32DRAFT_68471 [Podila humilis]
MKKPKPSLHFHGIYEPHPSDWIFGRDASVLPDLEHLEVVMVTDNRQSQRLLFLRAQKAILLFFTSLFMPTPFTSHLTMALLISQYLMRKEVIRCMCVSREWESLFTLCLWSDVSLEEVVPTLNTSRRTNTSQPTQKMSLILGHGHLIHCLSISTSTLGGRLDKAAAYALKECRNIEVLRLNQLDKGRTTSPRNKNNAFVWSAMRDLVLANGRLRRIEMGFMGTSFGPGFLLAACVAYF